MLHCLIRFYHSLGNSPLKNDTVGDLTHEPRKNNLNNSGFRLCLLHVLDRTSDFNTFQDLEAYV